MSLYLVTITIDGVASRRLKCGEADSMNRFVVTRDHLSRWTMHTIVSAPNKADAVRQAKLEFCTYANPVAMHLLSKGAIADV